MPCHHFSTNRAPAEALITFYQRLLQAHLGSLQPPNASPRLHSLITLYPKHPSLCIHPLQNPCARA